MRITRFEPMGLWRRLAAQLAGDDELRGKPWFALLTALMIMLAFGFFISVIVMLLKTH